jgi:hypothetical protein
LVSHQDSKNLPSGSITPCNQQCGYLLQTSQSYQLQNGLKTVKLTKLMLCTRQQPSWGIQNTSSKRGGGGGGRGKKKN